MVSAQLDEGVGATLFRSPIVDAVDSARVGQRPQRDDHRAATDGIQFAVDSHHAAE